MATTGAGAGGAVSTPTTQRTSGGLSAQEISPGTQSNIFMGLADNLGNLMDAVSEMNAATAQGAVAVQSGRAVISSNGTSGDAGSGSGNSVSVGIGPGSPSQRAAAAANAITNNALGSDGIRNGEDAEFEEGVLSGDREDWDAGQVWSHSAAAGGGGVEIVEHEFDHAILSAAEVRTNEGAKAA